MHFRAAQLCTVVLLLQLALSGCLALVIREDDEVPVIAGKVVARTVLAIPTFGFSELQIAQDKEIEESRPFIVTQGSHNPRFKRSPSDTRSRAVVVWGNHQAAESSVVDAVLRSGDTVVERARLQTVFDEQKIRLTHSSDDVADLLRVGRLVGADIVIFAEVSDRAETRRGVHTTPGAILPIGGMLLAVPPRSENYSETLHHVSVAVRGVNVEEGTVRWSGSASFSKPISNPETGIGYLINSALNRATCPIEEGYEWVEQGPWRDKWGCLKRGE